jgi:uncharacterized membrane protein
LNNSIIQNKIMASSEFPDTQRGTDPKLVGVLSYITFFGWIVALILNNPKTEFGSFHIRQSLGILLIFAAAGAVNIIPILGWIAGAVGFLLALVLWIMGIVGAAQQEMRIVPVLGDKFQEWFHAL